MRRRLDVAAALVQRPPVLFLDEPTTGLDIQSRTELWEVIRELVADGSTVLLTTQYLEEADQLADRIAVVDHGRIVANDTATALKARLGEHGHRDRHGRTTRPARGRRRCSPAPCVDHPEREGATWCAWRPTTARACSCDALRALDDHGRRRRPA